jgi:hypothetical protein
MRWWYRGLRRQIEAWQGALSGASDTPALATPRAEPAPLAVPQPRNSIDSVGWMAGHWIGTGTDDLSEEVWLEPGAGAMLGMWRWATGGKTRLYELLAIAVEEDRIVLRLKHFRPNLHGLEEKDAPFVLTAVRAGDHEVVFEGPGTDGLLRITYRSPDPNVLEATVEHGGRRDSFTYKRK